MDASLFSIVDSYPEFESGSRDRYEELVHLAEVADVSGIRTLWVAEHHFHDGGVNPATPVLLARVAGTTQRLRLGAMVAVVPFHRPVELAEQFALLDRLSHGRVEMGLGSGYLGLELAAYGITPELKRERFDRGLATLRAAWSGAPVRASEEATSEVRLNLRPVQAPHPPLWVAVQRNEAIPFVARMGASVALVPYATLGGIDELRRDVATYRAALPAGASGRVAAAMHVYVGDDLRRGRAALQRFLDSRLATASTFYLAKVKQDPRHASAEHLEERGLVALGNARTVSDRIRALADAGVDELLAIVDYGGISPETAEATTRALPGLVPRG